MQRVLIRLSNTLDHTNIFEIKLKLVHSAFVLKWVERVLCAQQHQYPLSEPWAFYHLNNEFTQPKLVKKINSLMEQVNEYEQLFDCTLTDINDQDTLNLIHSIFETTHVKLDEWLTNPLFKDKPKEFRLLLSQINQHVHMCESYKTGKLKPKIRFVWFDLPKVKFATEDYQYFTDEIQFGTLYSLYSDVGKPIEDLAQDNDEHHHDVVPNLHYSADCRLCFWTDADIKGKQELYTKYKNDNEEYLKSKGYELDDPRLTTGHIPLARIEYIDNIDQNHLLDNLKNYNHVQSFALY